MTAKACGASKVAITGELTSYSYNPGQLTWGHFTVFSLFFDQMNNRL